MNLSFADYYDALMSDPEATQAWADYVKSFISEGCILECACGSGKLAFNLAQAGFRVTAMDLDPGMIERAKFLHDHKFLEFRIGDMLKLDEFGTYDAILLFGDSLNYLTNKAEVRDFLTQAYRHINAGGYLLFDMHSANRYSEFENEYVEEGFIDEQPYQWSILSEEPDKIHHHFAFYGKDMDVKTFAFTQRVFGFDMIMSILDEFQTDVDIRYDFNGLYLEEAEKVFFAVRKRSL